MIVGQKVICVDDVFPPAAALLYVALPVKDKVYVIRQVSMGCNWQSEAGEVCLHLIGLHNPKSSVAPFRERGFNSERFRPLEEKTETVSNTEIAKI